MTLSFVSPRRRCGLLICLCLALLSSVAVKADLDPVGRVKTRSTRKERAEMKRQEAERDAELRRAGQDEVGHTKEAAAMRKYQLRKKMRKGILRKREADLASVLFPGASPELYMQGEEVLMYTDLVNSKKTQ
ncbi:MAG: hypothetical protein SGARI_001237, partial [Bacillariaceae sp.]